MSDSSYRICLEVTNPREVAEPYFTLLGIAIPDDVAGEVPEFAFMHDLIEAAPPWMTYEMGRANRAKDAIADFDLFDGTSRAFGNARFYVGFAGANVMGFQQIVFRSIAMVLMFALHDGVLHVFAIEGQIGDWSDSQEFANLALRPYGSLTEVEARVLHAPLPNLLRPGG